jgi:hypothetical protein
LWESSCSLILNNEADIAKVQEWLGHANVSATRLYDRRKSKAGGHPDISCEVLKPLEESRIPLDEPVAQRT